MTMPLSISVLVCGLLAMGAGEADAPATSFYTDVPAHDVDLVLGRPTATGVTVSVLAYTDLEAYFTYGTDAGHLDGRSAQLQLRQGRPQEVLLSGLQPDTEYVYRLHRTPKGTGALTDDPLCTFHTKRASGAPFVFTVQADSHLDNPECASLYARTLRAALRDHPDFHVDLGDTFMTEKRRPDYTASLPQYLAQRYYFGLLCHSAPLFLVVGNHDGETGLPRGGLGEGLSTWAAATRAAYFPSPCSDGFYSGSTAPQQGAYYAWEWGDALFVVLDPYRFTTSSPRGPEGLWTRTLGETQYRWLVNTLEHSTASFKFVFIHNLVGGADGTMRGGAEAARYFEWGGRDLDGRYTFPEHRPSWEAPVHDVLKRNGVGIVFHGHDHFFAHQEFDGVVYQLVPQPSRSGGRDANGMAAQYGYQTGDFLPSPGYLRVLVEKDAATVSYINTSAAEPETVAPAAFQYRLNAARLGSGLGPGAGELPRGDRP